MNEPARRFLLFRRIFFSLKMFHANISGIRWLVPMHYRSICATSRFVNNKFFKDEEVFCGCLNRNTPLKQVHPLTRNVDTAFVTFANFGTGITFGPDTYDY